MKDSICIGTMNTFSAISGVFKFIFLSLFRSKLENDKSSNNFSLLVYSKNFFIF